MDTPTTPESGEDTPEVNPLDYEFEQVPKDLTLTRIFSKASIPVTEAVIWEIIRAADVNPPARGSVMLMSDFTFEQIRQLDDSAISKNGFKELWAYLHSNGSQESKGSLDSIVEEAAKKAELADQSERKNASLQIIGLGELLRVNRENHKKNLEMDSERFKGLKEDQKKKKKKGFLGLF